MKNQTKYTLGISLIVILIIIMVLVIFNSSPNNKNTNLIKNNTQNNKETTNPTTTTIQTGTDGFKIEQAIVENNADPTTKKIVSDHLEITLKNTINKDLSNFIVDYSIEDTKTSKNESYHADLGSFILKSQDTQTIHFDNQNITNHYWVNKYSLYYLSQDPLKFTITVSANGYKSQSISVNKDAGGAEQVD